MLHISGVLDSYTIGECLVSLPPECTDELAVKQNSAPYLRIRLEFSAWQEWTQDFLHSMDVRAGNGPGHRLIALGEGSDSEFPRLSQIVAAEDAQGSAMGGPCQPAARPLGADSVGRPIFARRGPIIRIQAQASRTPGSYRGRGGWPLTCWNGSHSGPGDLSKVA